MTVADFRTELGHRINSRIHVASKPHLRFAQSPGYGRERSIPDDEQINVAVAAQLTPGGRTEDEGDSDAVRKRRERLAQHIGDTGGLDEEGLQLRKDRRLSVRLEVDLSPLDGPVDQAGTRQRLEFPLHGALGSAGLPDPS